MVAACRAYGLTAVDGVFNNFKDEQGFSEECRQGRAFGFDGKTLIHPAQIELAEECFSPSAAELMQASRIIAAFAEPENEGKGVITVDGKMTERLHLAQAERLVAIEAAIASRG